MMPIQEKIARHADTSLKLARRTEAQFAFQWHQHPEIELTLIESGAGQRFVGDHIEPYHRGDLVLLGPNLPHTWASHPDTPCQQSAVVAQFDPRWLEQTLAHTPEAGPLRQLIHKSRRGLRFTSDSHRPAADAFAALMTTQGLDRVLGLIQLLHRLACCRPAEPLASPAYDPDEHRADPRVDKVCRFIHDHATEPITQSQAAELIHMSGPAFSRFFRQRVGLTYSRYLHELRIGHACRLLLETELPITQVGFTSGFNNLSNFNRVFRSIKGESPRAYRRHHVKHHA